MAERDSEIEFKKIEEEMGGELAQPILKETVSKLLSSFFKEDKTKLSGDAALLMAEMLKTFVLEAAQRSMKQAESEDCDRVDVEHFEKILPQLLLDF